MTYLPNGEAINVPQGLNRVATLDLLETQADEFSNCKYAELIAE